MSEKNMSEEKISQDQNSPDVPEEKAPPPPLPAGHPSRVLAERTATHLSMQNFLLKNYWEQSFSIAKGLEVRYRTLSVGVIELIYRMLKQSHGQDWPMVFENALRYSYVAACLQSINGNSFGEDLDALLYSDSTGESAKKALSDRIASIRKYPAQLVDLMYAHYLLFEQRCLDYFNSPSGVEEMGNS